MGVDVIVWVLAVPNVGLWLKELIHAPMSKRLVFSDFFPDGVMEFGTREGAVAFQETHGLDYLQVEDHMYIDMPKDYMFSGNKRG